ncbi:arylsulfatase [Salmonella enterica]|nr:arylsulfatase [Salmonella enterica]
MKKQVTLATLSIILSGTAHSTQNERPDIIVIIADDMGYSDITPFGGEIPTPNLQAMAENGVRMSQYYTSPMSAPARAMLLTGNTSQQAGIGGMWWYENTIGKEGYELRLTDRVTTMAERFKDAGYNTLMAGKWHLGFTPGSTPKDRGFRHSFALMGGGASHFDDAVPLGTVEIFHTYYTRDNQRISLPSSFYSSEAYASQINRWISETPREQPIFAWLAFTAPHDPLQAPDEWISRFKSQYEQGYADVYRQRIARLKKLGFLRDDIPLPGLELDKEWQAMTPEQQKYTAKVMQVYAAMIANMDAQIGTVIETLKKTGRDKNTILVFLSDNGVNPAEGFHYESEPDFWKQFDNRYENIGRKNSFISYGPHWADVSNAPYGRYHKTTSGQGGINTSFMISGPGIIHNGAIDNATMAAYDVAPTLYEFAGIDVSKSLSERPTLPMIGVSFKRYLTGESLHAPRTQYGVELHNQAAWIDGEWKLRRLVTVFPQAGNAPWELFNLQRDPLETHNLAADYVDKVKILSSAYEAFAKQTMVLYAKGKLIDYVGIDSKTGRYLAVDPQTLQPVPAPLAIPLDTKSDQ